MYRYIHSLLILIFTCLMTNAFAYDYKGERTSIWCPPKPSLKDGIYIGFQAGYDAYRIRASGVLAGTTGNLAYNPVYGATGVNENIFIGYGQYYDWFYIAGELYAKNSAAKTSANINFDNASYQLNFNVHESYGVAILPGVKVNRAALVYARLGALRTLTKVQEYGSIAGIPYNDSATPAIYGINFGLGMETLLCKNWSMRMEYVHTRYNDFIKPLNTKFNVSNNEANLGIIYHFDLY